MTKTLTVLGLALALGACAAAKPDDFAPIAHGPGGPKPATNREAAYAVCRPQADMHGEQGAMVTQSMQGGFSAYGRPAFVAGAALGHALGSAIQVETARARNRDLALAACMAQQGYTQVRKD